jgi:hypothetical protein
LALEQKQVRSRKSMELNSSVQFNKTSARDIFPDENNPQPDFSFFEPSNGAGIHDVLQPVEQNFVQKHPTVPAEGIPCDAKELEKHLTDAKPNSDNKNEIVADPTN